jgi:hypothetical protein
MRTVHMAKPWYQSLTIKGALLTGLSVLLHPAVFDILPAKVATAVSVIGGVTTTIGLRRAIANPAP